MPAKLPQTELRPQNIRSIGVNGLIRQAEVDDILIPEGAVTEVINFHFDRKGASIVRPGLTALGSTVSAGNPCLGMHNVQSQTALVAFTTVVYNRSDASTWDAGLTGLTSGQKTRFVDFANRTIMVNGSYDSIHVWNGSNAAGWVTSGNPINPNQFASDATVNTQTLRAKYIEVFKSRIFLAGDPTSPDRLFFSSVIGTTGNLTWNPATDYVDINPSDGENITALKRYSLELVVFKPNYIYRFRTSSTDPDPLIKIGTSSQESVIEGKQGLYFHHPTGFYRYTGGYPEELSRPISDIVDAISYSNYSNIAAWKDTDHIYWFVGNITPGDTRTEVIPGTAAWTSVVVRYTESSGVWTVYSYPTNPVRGMTFNNGSSINPTVGLSTGVVATFNSGTTDLSEPIKYRIVTKWYEWEGIATRKMIQQMIAICEKPEAMELMYQFDNDYAWHSLGQIKKFITYFDNISIRFHRIRFKITGITSQEAAILFGIEIIKGLNEGIVVNQYAQS